MNSSSLRREAFMLLFLLSGLKIFSQSFTEAASFATGPDNIWKTSYTYWIDVDNDKDLDILNIEAESGGVSKLFINDNPGFHAGPSLPFSVGDNASAGDFDKDGFVDFVMLGSPVRIYRNNGNQTFSAMPDNTIPSTILITGESIDFGDYDNDGDLDLLHNNKVFRNNGNNPMTLVESIEIKSMMEGSSKWVDYDNDGDLDILITGSTPDGYQTKIYNNTGNDIFKEVTGLSLASGTYGVTEWGDYDNDGDLDFLISGYNGYPFYFTVLYKNNGSNNFTLVNGLPFSGLTRGSARWGDFDNDGDLDILFAGLNSPAGGSEITRIYRNKGNDTFEQYTDYTFPGIGRGTAAWGDFDKDGDLDISLIGNSATGTIAKLYRNTINPANKIPSSPQSTQAIVKNQDVTLKWKYVNDGDAPYKGITYNIRVGSSTGQNNLMPSHSSSDGYRKIAEFGNVSQDTFLVLKKVPFGTYWWAVQAIDNNFEGGAFSTEGSFLVQAVQTGNLSARILNPNSLTLKWERGTGDRCIVFGKKASTGIAEPIDNTGYIADSEIGFGSQIGTSGWFCVYNGRADSVIVTGLLPNTLYSFHIFEYSGSFGSEDYMTNLTGNGNPGIFSTSNFPHQTSIVFGAGDYHNKALWADYDKDGYQDILVVGNPTKLYKNGGNNTFVVVPGAEFSFPSIESGAAVWGDFDNDDDLDLLLTGNPLAPISKIFRNKGALGFEDIFGITNPITPVSFSAIDLGDYDNDGDLDILINGATGTNPNFNPVSKVYRNNGNNQFAEQTGITLTGLYKGSAKWADYDNDGDLDIFMTGTTASGLFKTEIYKNNGSGNFSPVTISIPGFNLSTVSFGDYDNDGDLDIIMGAFFPELRIYENTGNDNYVLHLTITPPFGTSDSPSYGEWGDFNNDGFLDFIYTNSPLWFTKIYLNTKGETVPGAESQWFYLYDGTLKKSGNGTAALCDYDNDGDIDILLSKWDAPSVIRNSFIMKSGSYLPNSAPNAPSGLSSNLTPAGVWLKWNTVKNDETPSKSMSYNVRIGKAPNTWDFCSSNSNPTSGFRMINELGNAQTDTTFFLKNLPSGTYYWAVQAIDQGYKGGSWSTTKTFEVKNVQTFFSATEVCLGLPTQFTDESVATKGIASWLWDFGDGTTSTSQHPQHTYASSGTYSVKLKITDTESSTDFLIKSVNVKPKPTANFTANTVCQGAPTSLTNTTSTNGLGISVWSWSFGDGQSSSSQNPLSHTYTFAGDYTVVMGVAADNGCSDQISKTVTVAAYPVVAISADGATTFCTGQSVTLSTTPNAQYTFSWKRDGNPITGANTNSYTASISGSYTVAVTNTVGSCLTNSSGVSVTANTSPAAPLISASGPLTFCQGQSVDLSVTYTTGYSYQWKLNGGAVGTNSNIYTATASGTYSLEVANAFGCKTLSSNTVNVTVNSNPSVPTVSISGSTTFCQGNNVELSVTGTGGYTYQWENNSSAITGATSTAYIANSSGVYALKITNPNNCFSRTENVNVTVLSSPSAPTITPSGPTTFCQGELITLSVVNTPGYSYQWKLNGGDVGTGSSIYTVNASGTYSLEVANASGCKTNSTNTVNVTVNSNPSIPTVNISGPATFCQGNNVELSVTATGGYTYQWENNSAAITGATSTAYIANSSGIYSLKITNANNCISRTENVNVSVLSSPSAPTITASGPATFCQDGSILLSVDNTPGYSYQWKLNGGTVGSNSNAYTASASGTYNLTVTNASNCSVSSSNNIAVTVNPKPTLPTVNISGPTSFCQGGSVELSVASTPGYEYQWENSGSGITGAIFNSYSALSSGNYVLRIANSYGCSTKTENVAVTVASAPSAPLIVAAGSQIFCQGDSVELSVTPGTGYNYQWKLNGGTIGANAAVIKAKNAGTYSLTVANTIGCYANSTNTVDVTVKIKPSLPTVNLSGPTTFCQGSSVDLSVTSASGYTYQWENNSAAISGATLNKLTANTSGVYALKITNTDNCFIKSENITVNVLTIPSAPTISASSATTFCQGDSVVLSVVNTPGYSYQWRLNGGSVGTNSNQLVAKTSGAYDIVVSNSSGCSVTSLVPVPVVANPLPVLSIITVKGEEKFCSGESTNLSVPANKDYIYAWKKGTGDLGVSTNSIDVTESGNYTVELNLAGCKLTAEPVAIEVVAKPARPDINPGTHKKDDCLGDNPPVLSVDNLVPGYTYQWYKNETPLSNATSIEVTESGNYYLEAVVDICTSERALAEIVFPAALPKPDLTAKGPTIWILSTSSKAEQYKWFYNGDHIPSADNKSVYLAGQKMGTYRVAISNDGKCFSFSDKKTIPDIVGIEETDPFTDVRIYPNPTTGLFTIEMNNNVFGELVIDVITQNGSKILNIKFDKSTEHFMSQIDLSGQPNGMYLINLSLDKFRAVRKVLVE